MTLLALYDALAAVSLTFDGAAVGVRSLADLTNNVHAADLPLRLLLPIAQPATGATGYRPLDASGNYGLRVTLPDVLLVRPASHGAGIHDVARQLVQYADDYAANAPAALKSATARVLSVRANPQIVEWPQGSGTHYVAVVCTIDLEVIL